MMRFKPVKYSVILSRRVRTSLLSYSVIAIAVLILAPVLLPAEVLSLIRLLEERAEPLVNEESLDKLVARASQHRLVLLGESTHGTSEYYKWRYLISRKLIEEYGFDFIVVEGDWPGFYVINKQVKGISSAAKPFRELFGEHFNRWPQWMWANEETLEMVEWLAAYNKDREPEKKTGIYGMDVYSKKESVEQVAAYLNSFDNPDFVQKATLLNCFARFDYDGSAYARAIHFGHKGCEENVQRVVSFLREQSEMLGKKNPQSFFNAKHNALIVKNAERHFRTAVGGGAESWNHRAAHFFLTAERLLDFYGSTSKGVVWAHNTHIGDARATSMTQDGSKNIGQMAREKLGRENVFLVGFGCSTGRVLAGSSWGSSRMEMAMPVAPTGSVESILDRVSYDNYYFLMDDQLRQHNLFRNHIGHRAVGVVYNPAREFPGNYVPSVMGERYDAFIFIKETTPLKPLHR